MALDERIKACRQSVGLSQEKVAELVGVSRQAVTKWESGQSAPNTENLFRLAEIFGTSVDLLLSDESKTHPTPAEQIYYLYKMEEERKTALVKQSRREHILWALLIAAAYLAVYLIGRILWCDLSQSSLLGWLFSARPSGEHSYLYGWLLSRRLFWYAMALSVLSAFCGKRAFACATLVGFVLGLLLGMVFGPYPEGAATGNTHYGWLIWGIVFFLSVPAGIFLEHLKKTRTKKTGV